VIFYFLLQVNQHFRGFQFAVFSYFCVHLSGLGWVLGVVFFWNFIACSVSVLNLKEQEYCLSLTLPTLFVFLDFVLFGLLLSADVRLFAVLCIVHTSCQT